MMIRLAATMLFTMACRVAGAAEGVPPSSCRQPPGRQAIELHVHARSHRADDLRRLATRLGRDGFAVLFAEDGGDGLPPRVSVEALPSRFRQVFGVRLENRLMPRSANDGFYCQLRVVHLTIPKRYRGLVDGIQVPDPQLD